MTGKNTERTVKEVHPLMTGKNTERVKVVHSLVALGKDTKRMVQAVHPLMADRTDWLGLLRAVPPLME